MLGEAKMLPLHRASRWLVCCHQLSRKWSEGRFATGAEETPLQLQRAKRAMSTLSAMIPWTCMDMLSFAVDRAKKRLRDSVESVDQGQDLAAALS